MSSVAQKAKPELTLGDFQARLNELQNKYNDRITQLRLEPFGSPAAIEAAAFELQSRLSELFREFQSRLETPLPAAQVINLFDPGGAKGKKDSSPPLYDNSTCSLNLDLAVYDGDRDALAGLLGDPQFVYAADSVLKENSVFQHQRDLLKRSFHMPRALAPKLHAVGERCRKALGLKAGLSFYVHAEPAMSACCYTPDADRICVILSSATVDRLEEDELTFLVGHELAHSLYDHHRLPINLLLERGGQMLFPAHALKIYAWKRNAEITADRIGLICCLDPEAAASALFKMSTGTGAERFDFHLLEYRERLTSGEHPEVDSGELDPEDWHSMLPFNPARIRALSLFAKSSTFHRLQQPHLVGPTEVAGESGGKSLMEASIRGLMTCFEPAYLHDRGDISMVIREFIFLGGYAVTCANGANEAIGVNAPGVQALASILDPDTMQRGVGKVEGADEDSLWTAIGEAARELKLTLPAITRLNIVKDLVVISYYAGGSVSRQELEVLSDLATTLDLRPEFVDQVLHSLVKGLD